MCRDFYCMISKNQIKYINSLKLKKHRYQNGFFLVEGEKCVDELLKSQFATTAVYALKNYLQKSMHLLLKKKIQIQEITEEELSKISDLTTPNQVLAIARMPLHEELNPQQLSGWTLVLDGIKDPGNLGTILRTADWFGINTVVCSTECVDVYNSKVVQATMGSFTRVRTYYTELSGFLEQMVQRMPVLGAFLEGEAITNVKTSENGVLVIGSESHGISEKLTSFISKKINIPRFIQEINTGFEVESLNASVAAAILCYEIRRSFV